MSKTFPFVRGRRRDASRTGGKSATRRRLVFVLPAFVLVLGLAVAYTQKDRYAHHLAEVSRDVIGDENTARLESWYFAVQDRIDQAQYRVFGGDTNPFADEPAVVLSSIVSLTDAEIEAAETADQPQPPVILEPPKPAPLLLPETVPLRANLEPGEGVWTTAGLPRSTPEDVLMAKTFVRPDPARPYANVGVLLLDKRRIRLHITGGTQDPGGDRGVKGPGMIPPEHRPVLLAAWNGGFQGPHGSFGTYADGRQYRPLRPGYASAVVLNDGTISIGEWGRDVFWTDDIVAVRQNAILLVDNCEVSKRTREGNNTWGYVRVDSSEFITWRSAIGLTRNGDLLVAAGNSLSAESLARALWSAGACYAMQLDINSPYVLTSLYHQQPDGSLKGARFLESMGDNPNRFLSTQARDFMYVTLDESRFIP